MQNGSAIPHLTAVLSDEGEDAMVRHEAGEALGAIGDASVLEGARPSPWAWGCVRSEILAGWGETG